jgi:hypothetical protein
MPTPQNSSDSDLERRWRTWREKSDRADRSTEKRMKILFSATAVILLAWLLYYLFRGHSNHVNELFLKGLFPTVRLDGFS